MNKNNKILDKIKKLLALQKSAEDIGSLEEAQNAAAQISKLVLKYNIDMADIREDNEEDRIGVMRMALHEILPYNKTHGRWLHSLYHVVAKFNFCKTLSYNTQPGLCIIEIWGEEHNVAIALDITFNYATQIISLEKIRWEEYKDAGDKRNSFRRAYYAGACDGLARALRNARYEEEREAQREQDEQAGENVGNHQQLGTTALVRVVKDNELALKKKIEENAGPIKKARATSNKSMIGRIQGYADGQGLDKRKSIE